MINLKRIIIDILEYAVMMIIVLYGQSVYIRTNFIYRHYFYYDIVASAIIILLIIIRGVIYKPVFSKMLFNIGFWIFYLYYYNETYKIILCQIVLPTLCLIFYLNILVGENDVERFVKKFSDIVVILAVLSLFCYLLGTIMHILPPLYDTYKWAGRIKRTRNYMHLMYEAQRESFFGHVFVRNCGIFCEAPSYAVPLIFSLFYEVFISIKKSYVRISILLLTILTSLSTKALLICIIMFALYLFEKGYVKATKKLFSQAIRYLLPIIIVGMIFIFIALIEQKSEAQFTGRMTHYYTSYKVFKDNWLVGVGIGNEEGVAKYLPYGTGWKGFSVGAPLILAEGGLVYTLYYVVAWLNAFICSKDKYKIICLGVVHFSILFTSNIVLFLSNIFIVALEFSIFKKRKVLL